MHRKSIETPRQLGYCPPHETDVWGILLQAER
jgi:hypothetical protein